MTERMDDLRNCLMERLSLRKEREILVAQEREIFSPRLYLDCKTKLDTVNGKLHKLEWKIPQLSAQISEKLPTSA